MKSEMKMLISSRQDIILWLFERLRLFCGGAILRNRDFIVSIGEWRGFCPTGVVPMERVVPLPPRTPAGNAPEFILITSEFEWETLALGIR
ncbi:unnamed protein product [Sphenostylis stenocarpa]|uniref:Uncharacterized protein n=1 Tax=Sphenostylis stenocarpa TaxID=92480 RepID=A0AA86T387_9FABA|nr:unnamed protein product [Sphenostylis stenocarpa]